MADLRELLKEHGIAPERFLAAARAPEACEWREGRMTDKSPMDYVIEAFQWTAVECGSVSWAILHGKWVSEAYHERWLELEAAMDWLDPLEYELIKVENVGFT